MGTTALTPLPYPESTDQPFVHLDIKALADAVAERLYVASSAAPPHLLGRRWTDTDNGQTAVSDGTRWVPVDGRSLAQTVLTSGAAQTEAAGVETLITAFALTFDSDGASTYELNTQIGLQSTVAGDRIGVRVKRGATVVGDFVFMPGFAGVRQPFAARSFDVPPAGSVTYQVYFLRSGGTGTVQVASPSTTSPNVISARKSL